MADESIQITPEALNAIMPGTNDDYIPEGHRPDASDMVGATAAQATSYLQHNPGSFNTDSGVLKRNSQGKVEAQPIAYSPEMYSQQRHFAEAEAVLSGDVTGQFASATYKHELKQILEQANKLPKPDTRVMVSGKSVTIPYAATSFPANLDREVACEMIDNLMGGGEIGRDFVFNTLVPTALSAGTTFAIERMGDPKAGNPVVWLSQQMALETQRQETYDNMPTNLPVDPKNIENLTQILTSLFGPDTARNIANLARMHKVNILSVTRYLITKVCRDRKAVVNPPSGSRSKYTSFRPSVPGSEPPSQVNAVA